MNDEQKLRLRVASEQMAALLISRKVKLCPFDAYAQDAVAIADTLIAEVERTAKGPPVEPAPEKHPGWVFVDRDGDVWGWRPPTPDLPNYCRETARAHRPFLTREEAEKQGARTSFGCVEVREWRPTDRVPPMPEGE